MERNLANLYYEYQHQESQHKNLESLWQGALVFAVWDGGSDVSDNKIKLNFELETRLAIFVGNCVQKKVTKLSSEKTSTNEKFNLVALTLIFKYLGTTAANENCVHEPIQKKLNSRDPYHYQLGNAQKVHLLLAVYKIPVSTTGTIITAAFMDMEPKT